MKGAFYEHIPHYTIGLGKELGKYLDLDIYFNSSLKSYEVPNCSNKFASLSFPSYRNPKSALQLMKQVGRLRHYDIVHVNSSKQGFGALMSMKLYGVPYIYTNHGIPRTDTPESRKVDEREHRLLPRIARSSRAFVTISKFAQKAISETYGVKPYVIYHGVDFTRFNPQVSATAVKKNLGLKEKVILAVMRLHHHKDPFTLLRASKQVLKKQNAYLVIIGSGRLESELIQYTRNHQFADRVRFIPYVDWHDINQYYASADVVVLPSIREGFGMTIVEAMACGKPTIVADSGALPEVIGDTGLLFEPGSPDALAERMNEILSDDELREELSQKSLERVKSRFRWDIAAKKYLRLYSRTM